MPESIRVGLITSGEGAHLSAYLPALAKIEECSAVAVADPSKSVIGDARAALGSKLAESHADPREMLKKFKPQMVLVSLPANESPAAIALALEHGAHVMAEKPACTSVKEFAPLVKMAESKHLHLMLALANRIHAPVRFAQQLIAEGKLGKLYAMEVHIMADQTRLTKPAYHDTWFAKKERAGGGFLTWLAIHWLDAALLIAGKKVERVAGFAGVVGGQPLNVEDAVAMSMQLEGGMLGTLTAGYLLEKGYQSHLQIWGSDGWLRVAAIEEEPLEWYSRKVGPEVRKFVYPAGGRGYDPWVKRCVRAAADLEDPPITPRECLNVLETIFAMYRAAETGTTQTVKG